MSSQAPLKATKSSKPSKPTQSPSSSLSSHLAMIELKQKILTSLSKLSDRDTHQIAVEDLEKTIETLSPEAIPMLLNCLYDSISNDPKNAVKKEALRLLAFACQVHSELTVTHLVKIIGVVVKRLKDADSGVKDACRDVIGALAGLYLKGGDGGFVGVFVKPLFEAMCEQNKGVQSGAALCMAKMVECASNVPVGAFQKLCPRICKLLNSPNYLAKSSLLPVVASLSQVGAIQQQSLNQMLQSIHECLKSMDWVTRKAAADTLISLALHSSELVKDEAESTLSVLEACRFDKIKPVRDSMTEAVQEWKKVAGKGDGTTEETKDNDHSGLPGPTERDDVKSSNPKERKLEQSAKDSSNNSSPSGSISKDNSANAADKAAVLLKKKPPALSDKQLNPEFFQKLETRGSDDLPVEVVVPRKRLGCSNLNGEEESTPNENDSKERLTHMGNSQSNDGRVYGTDARQRMLHAQDNSDVREFSGNRAGFSKSDGHSDGSIVSNKGNWLAIQRQLLQLERQQTHLMNMLQDFMGGSHDSMVTLENRVRGLERVVEDMARDLSISSGRRSNSFAMGFEGSNRMFGKYNGFSDYLSSKYSGRMPFGERFTHSESSGTRGRGASWRSDVSEAWDFPTYGASRNEHVGFRRAPGGGSEHETDQVGSRRAWDKGAGPGRLGEGPSARSVWQASKDEATLEAIRIAGEDGGTSQKTRVAPERVAEAIGDDSIGQERDPIWNSWSNAMHALQAGDIDSAYGEVVSTGDDFLLVKLMDRSGPAIDQLSNEVALEVLNAIGQFLLDQSLYDICLSWIQQLVELVMENGPDVLGIPMEMKKELLLNFHEACSATDPPEEWEGATPDQLLLQLASSWGIDLQQFEK